PARTTWRSLRDRYLVPRALGIPEEAGETRSRLNSLDGLGAWLVRRRYDLPTGSGHTLTGVLEALACQRLGFPSETSLEAVRDKVLCRLLGVAELLTRDELVRQL